MTNVTPIRPDRSATDRERDREAGNFDQTQVESPARNMHVIEKAMPWLTGDAPRGSVF